jgi:elongator complex protein 2
VDAINDTEFVSGADEKLLRVFDEPRGVAETLSKLCNIVPENTTDLPDAANIPVLGLSNKAIQAIGDDEPVEGGEEDEREAVDPASVIRKSALEFTHPPFEDHLARHLLWPETEKLYGHGYEISAVAVSRDGSLVATACRASSIDHAVIRLYDTKEWLEVKPALKAHSLTVTSLQFSPDDKYLLSVGRDRQWVIWERSTEPSLYALKYSNPKGHSRMILNCAWIPLEQPTFLTGGRDKSVKVWQITDSEVQLKGTVTANASVTAVASSEKIIDGKTWFAFGTETGEIGIASATADALDSATVTMVAAEISPAKTINQIVWRPGRSEEQRQQIAVAADDSSVRVYNVAEGSA